MEGHLEPYPNRLQPVTIRGPTPRQSAPRVLDWVPFLFFLFSPDCHPGKQTDQNAGRLSGPSCSSKYPWTQVEHPAFSSRFCFQIQSSVLHPVNLAHAPCFTSFSLSYTHSNSIFKQSWLLILPVLDFSKRPKLSSTSFLLSTTQSDRRSPNRITRAAFSSTSASPSRVISPHKVCT